MAPSRSGGGFQVFSDSSAHVDSRPLSSKGVVHRRKPLVIFSDTPSAGAGEWNGKENFDPFAKSALVNLAGKKSLKGEKGEAKATMAMGDKTRGVTTTGSSNNGICTGTLYTRTLPTPPPLPKHYQLQTLPIRPRTTRARRDVDDLPSSFAPSLASIVLPPSPATHVSLVDTTSPSSAKDSGYAHSESDPESDMEIVSESDEPSENEGEALDDATVTIVDTDRLARALTESPLAEITRAFTSFGNFALPSNAGSSPVGSAMTSNLIRSSPTRPSRVVKPYDKMYSTTATTRKSGVVRTAEPAAPRSVKSMRV